MHEQALLQDLVRKVNEVAASQGSRRVTRVRLWVGALCHVTPAAIREGWPEVARATPATFARLEIETSGDMGDPRAQEVVLRSLDLEASAAPASS